MYIAPNTHVLLLNNIAVDPDYSNTLWFTSLDEQYAYFSSNVKHNLQNYSFQRVNRNQLKVGVNVSLLYDVNYLMFQNTSYSSKWFYAFVTSVEYINNDTSLITYELDVMQTWHFDYQLAQCYVEREHIPVANDTVGANIVPEPVELGEYVMNGYAPITQMTELKIILAIVDVEGATEGNVYDNVYGSAKLYAYSISEANLVNEKINSYLQKQDAIISIYMCPSFLIGNITEEHLIVESTGFTTDIVLSAVDITSDTLNGFKPKNNKMYTYPYNFFHVDNSKGSELALRYEFFTNRTPVVEIFGTISQPVEINLRPANYKGVPNYSSIGGYTTLNTESLSLSGYPLCSWNVDSYQAWIAQNIFPTIIQGLGGATRASISPFYSLATGYQMSRAVPNLISDIYTNSHKADISKGSFNNGGSTVAHGKQQFYGGRCSITHQYAEIIDKFFDRFGYAIKTTKQPERSSRPEWNYIKTGGCLIHGSVPASDEKKICSIYDNGITFWKNPEHVGIYTFNNR